MPAASQPRGMSAAAVAGLLLAAVVVAGGSAVGALSAAGVDLRALLGRTPPKPRPEGVPVPLSGRPIPAYTKVTRAHLTDPATGDPALRYLPKEEAERLGMLVDIRDIVGRVVNQDYPPGLAFTETSFVPKGTREGPSAAVPPGMRLFTLSADKVPGFDGLRARDRFDLLATLPVDPAKRLPLSQTPAAAVALALPPADGRLPRRATVRPIVQDGVIVIPRQAREVPVIGNTRRPNEQPKMRSVAEVTVAIRPDEVAPLTEALAVDAELICVARSGHPDDAKVATATPGSDAAPKLNTVELVVGGTRQVYVFPAGRR